MIRLGIVTDMDDPDKMRRVKVVTQDRGNSTSSWVPRVTGFDGEDSPVPPIGSTVIVASMQSDSADEVILGVMQTATSNQAQPLKDASLGSWFKRVLGDVFSSVSGYWKLLTLETITLAIQSPKAPSVTIEPSGQITLRNSLGSVRLLPSGYMQMVDPSGTWGSSSSGLSLNHPSQVSVNSPNLLWNGVAVSRVGGTDSRGDTTLS